LDFILKHAGEESERKPLMTGLVLCWIFFGTVLAAVAVDGILSAGMLERIRDDHFINLLGFRSLDISPERYPVRQEAIKFLILLFFAIGILTAIFRFPERREILASVFLVFAAADYLVFSMPLHFFSSEDIYSVKPAAARFIEQQNKPGDYFRIHCVAPPKVNDLAYGSRTPSDYLLAREVLYGSVSSQYHIFDTNGADSVKPEAYLTYLDYADSILPSDAGFRLLGVLNVKYLINLSHNWASGTSKASMLMLPDEYIMPRAYVVHNAAFIFNERQAVKLLADPTHDCRRTVVLNGSDVTVPKSGTGKKAESIVTSIHYEANSITMDLSAKSDGLLVLTERFSAGWRAFVDSQEVSIRRANVVQMAIPVSEGMHEVVLLYSQPGLYAGACVSLTTLFGIAGFSAARYVTKRKRTTSSLSSRQAARPHRT
jgi:hypothetical protein